MSEETRTERTSQKQMAPPPALLLVGVAVVVTTGSTWFVVAPGPGTATTNSAAIIPIPLTGQSPIGEAGSPARDTGAVLPSDDASSASGDSAAETQAVDEVAAADQRFKSLLVGNWTQDHFGKRTLMVREDGTASMVIEPSAVWALAFGNRIDLTMFWSVKDGHLDYGVSSGIPEDKVKMAAQSWGDHWVERIVDLTDERLDLLSEDGSSHSIWQRVQDGAEEQEPRVADSAVSE